MIYSTRFATETTGASKRNMVEEVGLWISKAARFITKMKQFQRRSPVLAAKAKILRIAREGDDQREVPTLFRA